MKAEYVVVAEQAYPLGPAYSFPLLLHIYLVSGYEYCCMCVAAYTALVSLHLSTVMPTSFNISMKIQRQRHHVKSGGLGIHEVHYIRYS